MTVREIMTDNPATCGPSTDLQKVAQMMVEHDCGAIPIVEDGAAPFGIITDRDITTRIVAQGQNPLQKRAKDAMTPVTVTVTPDEDVAQAERLMREQQVRRVVVVEDDRVVGIVAQADLAIETPEEEVKGVVEGVSHPSARASKPSPA